MVVGVDGAPGHHALLLVELEHKSELEAVIAHQRQMEEPIVQAQIQKTKTATHQHAQVLSLLNQLSEICAKAARLLHTLKLVPTWSPDRYEGRNCNFASFP